MNRLARFFADLFMGPDEIEVSICVSCEERECGPACERVKVAALVDDALKYAGHRSDCDVFDNPRGRCDCGWAEIEARLNLPNEETP